MITTVTLNAAIDKTYFIENFSLNRVNRTHGNVLIEPGGKGINVAKVLQQLDIPVSTTGFVGGFNGEFILNMLGQRGIHHNFLKINGESRICLNIIDRKLNSQTEILEAGASIPSEDWTQFKNKLENIAHNSEFVILSGSLPKGLPNDAYAELVNLIHHAGSKSIIDTSGIPLQHVIEAKPFMIKPNEEELLSICGRDKMSEEEIAVYTNKWNSQGIPFVVVSLGSKGVIVSAEGNAYRASPPIIDPVNPVGSGDSLVAGIAAGLHLKLKIEDIIKMGIAAGTANALESIAGSINLSKYKQLLNDVKVKQIK
ncbi:1-phosphofructokinase [Neobacillus sp. PS3-34]|uniref:1-phosphofructokinase n=1 Tax=Neobacillus sp. PS3-34 TaxID=3070678 RepID=UPI0027E0EBA7|nr:1-phosphofructokinase [Neobacillus sp. PS3-34]WML49083.1 1-phosphofructokinase [Neobacillus sp. PS3-34]